MRLSSAVIPLLMRRQALASGPVSRAPSTPRRGQVPEAGARMPMPAGVSPIEVDAEVDLAQRVRESGEW